MARIGGVGTGPGAHSLLFVNDWPPAGNAPASSTHSRDAES